MGNNHIKKGCDNVCTAVSFNACNHYFGRNLDLEKRYDESIAITPRNFIMKYKSGEIERKHYAFIGTATVIENYPLFYDATNEHGLSMAGLNFVGNAYLNNTVKNGSINLAPYELIPYILGKCKNVEESINLLKNITLIDIPFNSQLQNSELHWIIADKKECIVFEYMKNGAKIHNNPIGILTNNPPFEYQIMNLNNYLMLSASEPKNTFSEHLDLFPYSRGMGAIGLPGDNSSMSRFVRCCFNKMNSIVPDTELESVTQFFHILSSVEQIEGSVIVGNKYEKTQYTSCCNTEKGIYYYKTYGNSRISAVSMHNENIDADQLMIYKMVFTPAVLCIN